MNNSFLNSLDYRLGLARVPFSVMFWGTHVISEEIKYLVSHKQAGRHPERGTTQEIRRLPIWVRWNYASQDSLLCWVLNWEQSRRDNLYRVWNGTVKPRPHSSLTTTVLRGTRCGWRSRVMQEGSAGWLRNQIRVAPSLLSALLHQLVPHLGPGHLKLHREWFQPLPQITPIISDGGWELVNVASGFHRSLGDPAQLAEFRFVRAPLHTHLYFLTTCPVGFSTRPWNHRPRSTAERATTPGGCAFLVPGWVPHTAIVCFMASRLWVMLCFPPLSASQSLSGLIGKPSLVLPTAVPLFQHLMYLPAVALLHLSVSPCKFLEGGNDVSLMFVSPEQLSQNPMQKCSSINVCWLEVWFSLLYPLAFLGTAWVVTMTVSKRQLYLLDSLLLFYLFLWCVYT